MVISFLSWVGLSLMGWAVKDTNSALFTMVIVILVVIQIFNDQKKLRAYRAEHPYPVQRKSSHTAPSKNPVAKVLLITVLLFPLLLFASFYLVCLRSMH
jgi:hypothetical protein